MFFGGVVTRFAVSLAGFAVLVGSNLLRPEPQHAVDEPESWERIGKGWEND